MTPTLTLDRPLLDLLTRGGWLLEQIELTRWGTEVHLRGRLNDAPIEISLSNCDQLRWAWYGEANQTTDLQADVIGFDHHPHGESHKVVLHTDLFELIATGTRLSVIARPRR